ncbi:hypothetical protein WMO13_05500 [Ignatzschineria larvae DSM 13226]|uniref:Uncharacterized protein n=1 Tax=Ignatzschineria larvae DSM 13226 TaxID=1111732 RepID=A0ABZ3BWU4_9GAMM|nr:hypothetical protein [Ignatzschineria larvae]
MLFFLFLFFVVGVGLRHFLDDRAVVIASVAIAICWMFAFNIGWAIVTLLELLVGAFLIGPPVLTYWKNRR